MLTGLLIGAAVMKGLDRVVRMKGGWTFPFVRVVVRTVMWEWQVLMCSDVAVSTESRRLTELQHTELLRRL